MSNESTIVAIFIREIGYRNIGEIITVSISTPEAGYIEREINSFEEVHTDKEFLFALDKDGKTILKIRKEDIIERVYL